MSVVLRAFNYKGEKKRVMAFLVCIVLYFIVFYCIVLYCIVLYCIVYFKGLFRLIKWNGVPQFPLNLSEIPGVLISSNDYVGT